MVGVPRNDNRILNVESLSNLDPPNYPPIYLEYPPLWTIRAPLEGFREVLEEELLAVPNLQTISRQGPNIL